MYAHERSLVQKMQGRPFKLLGVNSDGKKSTLNKAIRENELTWRSWWDGKGGPIAKSFQIQGWPTIFLIDHKGVIRILNLRGEELEQALDYLVNEAEADIAAGTAPFPIREFVDISGKYKTRARFVKVDGENVVLEKESGGEVSLPLKRLGKVDQAYVEWQSASQDP